MKARDGARDAAQAVVAGVVPPGTEDMSCVHQTIEVSWDARDVGDDEAEKSLSESSGEDWDMEGLEQ